MSKRYLDYDINVSVSFQKLKYYNKEFTDEIYEEYFSDRNSYEGAKEFWENAGDSMDAYDLNSDVRENIINHIVEPGITDKMYNRHSDDSHTYQFGDIVVYLDEEPADEFIPYVFNSPEVDADTKREILEYAIHHGDNTGSIEFNDTIVREAVASVDSHEEVEGQMWVNGIVTVNGNDYPFDYCINTDEYEIHNYSDAGWMTGSCYDQTLPEEFNNDINCLIDSAICEAVEDYKELHDLDVEREDEFERWNDDDER